MSAFKKGRQSPCPMAVCVWAGGHALVPLGLKKYIEKIEWYVQPDKVFFFWWGYGPLKVEKIDPIV